MPVWVNGRSQPREAAHDRLAGALNGLDPSTRAMLELSLRHGVPDAELALLLGCGTEQVCQRRTEATRQLGAALERSTAPARTASAPPTTTLREDAVAVLLGMLLVLGLYLDGWNHINLQANELGAFLTPWHGLLYLGFNLCALWALARSGLFDRRRAFRRVPMPREVWKATPTAYRLGLVAIGMVGVALPGDAVWHEMFGEEVGVARVIGPFHLVLFTAIALLVSCPLVAAWSRESAPDRHPRWRELGPAVGSLALLGAVAAFLVHWTASFVSWEPSLELGEVSGALAQRADVVETLHSHGVASVLITTAVLVGPLALGWACFGLPRGACTVVLGVVAVLSAGLNEFGDPAVVAAALAGGLVGDAVAARLHPGPGRAWAKAIAAASIALAMWACFFSLLQWTDGVSWPRDVWLGATIMAALTAALIALVVSSPYPRRA